MKKSTLYILFITNLLTGLLHAQPCDISKNSKTEIRSDRLNENILKTFFDGSYEFDIGSGTTGYSWIHVKFRNAQKIDSVILHFTNFSDSLETNLRINLQLDNSLYEQELKSKRLTFNLDKETTQEIIIQKIGGKNWQNEYLCEIEVYSNVICKDYSFPKCFSVDNKNVIYVNNLIEGITENEIAIRNKKWKIIKGIYNKISKEIDDEYYTSGMLKNILTQNEPGFCYNFDGFIGRNEIADSSVYNQIKRLTNCNIEENYFDNNIKFPLELASSKYNYQNIVIDYRTKQGKKELEEIVRKGDAWGGHAAVHLALMNSKESYETIMSLQYDKNVFAQMSAIRAAKYFGKYSDIYPIVESIINKEFHCLSLDSISCHSKYAYWAAESLMDISPAISIDYFYKLYNAYQLLYPSNYFDIKPPKEASNSFCVVIELDNSERLSYNDRTKITSIQGTDVKIAKRLKRLIETFPHLSNNKKIEYILSDYDQKVAVHNIR